MQFPADVTLTITSCAPAKPILRAGGNTVIIYSCFSSPNRTSVAWYSPKHAKNYLRERLFAGERCRILLPFTGRASRRS